MESLRVIQQLSSMGPQRVLFWTGAGISHGTPSCLPIGDEMSNLVKRVVMVRTVVSALEKISRRRMRLEELLQAASQVVAVEKTYLIHDMFRGVEPNAIHFFLAEHLHSNGCVVTMNIDHCIEDAYRLFYSTWCPVAHEEDAFETLNRKKSLEGWLVKPHGSLFHSPMEQYGWTVSNVRKGLDCQLREALASVLKGGKISSIVFCGYSGRDDFDVNPFFESVRGHINRSVVAVWIKHAGGSLRLAERLPTGDGDRILKSFGTNSYVLEGETWGIFDTLRQNWGYDTQHERPYAPSIPDRSRFAEFFDSYTYGPPGFGEKVRITLECAKIVFGKDDRNS